MVVNDFQINYVYCFLIGIIIISILQILKLRLINIKKKNIFPEFSSCSKKHNTIFLLLDCNKLPTMNQSGKKMTFSWEVKSNNVITKCNVVIDTNIKMQSMLK